MALPPPSPSPDASPPPLSPQVGLYFAFLESVTRDLAVPALIGLLMQVLSALCGGAEDNPLLPLYAVSLLLWAPWLQQNWRRQEHRLAAKWAVADYEEEEPNRREFAGERTRGVYTHDGYFVPLGDDATAPLTTKFTFEQRLPRLLFSWAVVTPLVVALLCAGLSMLALKESSRPPPPRRPLSAAYLPFSRCRMR